MASLSPEGHAVGHLYHGTGFILVLLSIYFELAEANQELIVAEGGIGLLSVTADDADDPQTLRMVAGAIANLCGNGN